MIALVAFAVPQWFPRDQAGRSLGLLHVLLQEVARVSLPAPQTLLSMRLKGPS